MLTVLDYSFSSILALEEVQYLEPGQNGESKDDDNRVVVGPFDARGILLANNEISEIDSFHVSVSPIFQTFSALQFIDLSCNYIQTIPASFSPEILPDLMILYLHGNQLERLQDVWKLCGFSKLKTLTLHGNPFSEKKIYQDFVLHYLPQVKKLDFSCVTKSQREKVKMFGQVYRNKLIAMEEKEQEEQQT